MARRVLAFAAMANASTHTDESWTIPLHVIMWTTLAVGLIMSMAVWMMN